jgi:hypothetical protein
MNEPNNLNLSLTFGRGEVHICMPALAVKVEPSPSTGKAVRVWISLNKTRPGESPIEIALFPSPESFLEQFSDWIRRYRAPTPSRGSKEAREQQCRVTSVTAENKPQSALCGRGVQTGSRSRRQA